MWSILADLCIGFFDLVIDVLGFRGLRRKHGRRTRSVAEDTFEVARFNFITLVLIALVCAGVTLLLALGLGLPVGWSVGIGLAVGVVWGIWRYSQLVLER
jgi:phosphate/sulfate permease